METPTTDQSAKPDSPGSACSGGLGGAAAYEWEDEPWYQAQTAEWDRMEADGWMFGTPPKNFDTLFCVGLAMWRADLGPEPETWETFTLPQGLSPRETHTRLLNLALAHASGAVGSAA